MYSEKNKIDIDNLYGPKKILKKKTWWLLENKNWPTMADSIYVWNWNHSNLFRKTKTQGSS